MMMAHFDYIIQSTHDQLRFAFLPRYSEVEEEAETGSYHQHYCRVPFHHFVVHPFCRLRYLNLTCVVLLAKLGMVTYLVIV